MVMLCSENATSAEVNGVPSCHVTPGRSLIDQVSPSADRPPLATVGTSSASCGSISPLGATAQSGEYSATLTPSSTSMCGRLGSNTVGSCDRPMMTWPPGFGLPCAWPSVGIAPMAAVVTSRRRRVNDMKRPFKDRIAG